MAGSVDGIVSGMQTSQVIAGLVQAAGAPQAKLKQKVAAEKSVISAYQSINSKLAALQTAAEAMTKADSFKAAKAASSNTTVTATASTGAAPGTTEFRVTTLARAQTSTLAVAANGPVTQGSGVSINIGGTYDALADAFVGGTTHQINVTTDTPAGVASAINAANIGVQASVVNADGGPVLQLTATKTGTANSFTVHPGTVFGSVNTVTPASDAKVTVGDPNAGGYTVTSPGNTFTNAIPGITFTVTKENETASISVTSDSAAVADKMQAMVDAANAALGEIAKQTSQGVAGAGGGALAGEFSVRNIQQSILRMAGGGQSGFGSFKQLGLELDSGGKLKFDKAKFTAAFEKDPVATQAALSAPVPPNPPAVAPPLVNGLATQLNAATKKATDKISGTLTLSIKTSNNLVRNLDQEIQKWDVRLERHKDMLSRQFANMERALGSMKEQSNWLAGQIRGLG